MAALLTPSAHRRIQAVASISTVVVALCAAAISWSGLAALGRAAGMETLSVLLPIVIDGGMVVGSLHVLHSNLAGVSARWGWLMTGVGAGLSVWGNVAGSTVGGLTAAITHLIAPLVLVATVEASMRIIRHSVAATAAAEAEAMEAEQRRIAEQERRSRAIEQAEVRGRERAAAMAAMPAETRHAVEGDAQVAAIRAVASMLPTDASTTDVLTAVLRAIPDVQPRHIAAAEVVTVSNLHNALSRVRRRLAEQQQESAPVSDADADAEPERPALRALSAV